MKQTGSIILVGEPSQQSQPGNGLAAGTYGSQAPSDLTNFPPSSLLPNHFAEHASMGMNYQVSGKSYIMGDSISWFQSEPITVPGNGYSNDVESWFLWFNAQMGGTFLPIGNAAASGAGIAQLFGTGAQLDLCVSSGAKTAFLLIGANNFYISPVAGTTRNTVAGGIASVLRSLTNKGITAIVLNQLGRDHTTVGSNVWSATGDAERNAFLSMIPSLQSAFPEHLFVDVFSSVANSDGTYISGYSYDGLHPSALGAMAAGKAVASAVTGWAPKVIPGQDVMLSFPGDVFGAGSQLGLNKFAGCALTGTIGQTTLPSGWSQLQAVNCSATYLLKPDPYGPANQLEVTVTFSAAGNWYLYYADDWSGITRIASADKFNASCILDVIDSSNILSNAWCGASVTDGSNLFYNLAGLKRSADTSLAVVGNYKNQRLVTPLVSHGLASPTTGYFRLNVVSQFAGVATVRISQPAIWLYA